MPDRGRISWKQPRPHQACALEAWSWRAIKLELPPNSNHIFGTKSKQYSKHVWDNPIRYRPMISNALHDVATSPLVFRPSLGVFIIRFFTIFPKVPGMYIYLGAPFAELLFALANVFAITWGSFSFVLQDIVELVRQTNYVFLAIIMGQCSFCYHVGLLRLSPLLSWTSPWTLCCAFFTHRKKSLGLSTISIWWVRYFFCAVL